MCFPFGFNIYTTEILASVKMKSYMILHFYMHMYTKVWSLMKAGLSRISLCYSCFRCVLFEAEIQIEDVFFSPSS